MVDINTMQNVLPCSDMRLSQPIRPVSHPHSILKEGAFTHRLACKQSKVPHRLLLCDVGVFHSKAADIP